ncbi:MAG: hypothetical protein JRJ60_14970, partial [Deltaproteobacteria bacterium]|nr:hypothetical protein [Deltaproteobacteria bacterium]
MSCKWCRVFIAGVVAAMISGLIAPVWADVILSTLAGVKGPSTGFTNADANGTYRFRNFIIQDFGESNEKARIGNGYATFDGEGGWTGSAVFLNSDGSSDNDTMGGTYSMDPSGSFTFTVSGDTPSPTFSGHISKDAGRQFFVATFGGNRGVHIDQSIVVGVKERATAPGLSTLNGTYIVRHLAVYHFETQHRGATALIADITCNGAGSWSGTYTSYNAIGGSNTGPVTGTYAVNGKSFDFYMTGETGVFFTADLSSNGNVLVASSTSASLADGEQFVATMVKRNPGSSFSNASLNGSYKLGQMQLDDFVGNDPETYVIDATVTFNGAGGFSASYNVISKTGSSFAGTSSGVYAVSADGSFSLTVTSETPNFNMTGTISPDGHVLTLTRADGGFSAPGELFLDMGTSGLYAFDGFDMELVAALDASSMAAIEDGLAVGFTGFGLYTYDGSAFTALTPAVPEEMIFWSETLVADFGIYGVWAYNGSTWTALAAADPQGMAVWGSNIAIYFPGYGVWSYNGSSWSQVTPASVEQLVGWGSQLVIDFGDVWGVYAYTTATPTQISMESPEDM